MENLTLGEIAKTLAFVVGFIGSIKYLKNGTIKGLSKTINQELTPIKIEIELLKKESQMNYLESIKTDLINLMELAERGIISVEQKMRMYELYDYYSKHGGNSYVHDKWEKLKKMNKI